MFLSGTWPFVLTARFEPDAAGLSRASSQHADSRSRDRGAAGAELMKMIVSGSNEGAGNAWCALRAALVQHDARSSRHSFSRDNRHSPRDAVDAYFVPPLQIGIWQIGICAHSISRTNHSVGAVGELPTEPALTRSMPN